MYNPPHRLLLVGLAYSPTCPPRPGAITLRGPADELFEQYASAAPAVQSGLCSRCWDIVEKAVATTVPGATSDASAFGGALEAFVAAGPDDPSLIPEEQRPLITKLSDTAASYKVLRHEQLSWGTRYRTLNRPLGAFFCGISLWPRTSVDVPNFTLYFGSGSSVNPDRLFMRLELIPRVDTDTDAAYAETYYAPSTSVSSRFSPTTPSNPTSPTPPTRGVRKRHPVCGTFLMGARPTCSWRPKPSLSSPDSGSAL